jgi:SAM-dependent methyltransferase
VTDRQPDTRSLEERLDGNIAEWTRINAEHTDRRAEAAYRQEAIAWGVFQVPETSIGSPLGDVSGLDVVELGCGTAYVSAWLAKRGARAVGVDPTPAQLATARRAQAATGIAFPLVEAPAEAVPLPDGAFDLAVSEYGASLWADPERWVAEASRLLRPGGRLVFLTNSTLAYLCFSDDGPVTESLQRPQFGMSWTVWPGSVSTEFHRSHGDWIALLRANDFSIERLIELQAPDDGTGHEYYDDIPVAWGRRWPAEEIWVARKQDHVTG